MIILLMAHHMNILAVINHQHPQDTGMGQSNTFSGFFRLLLLLVVLGSFSFPVHSASQCKGLSSSACSASTECTWVEGFKRSDGVKVKSYCRALPSKAKKSAGKKKDSTSKQDAKKSGGSKNAKTDKKSTAVTDGKEKKRKQDKKAKKDKNGKKTKKDDKGKKDKNNKKDKKGKKDKKSKKEKK